MRIPLTVYGLREIAIVTVACSALATASLFLFWPIAVVLGVVWLCVLAFFRDPQRPVPGSESELLSPADGTVVDVQETQAPAFLTGPTVRIGIFMSIFDVHVNRSPTRGVVRYVRYFKGAFHDARSRESTIENEHNLVGLETSEGRHVLLNQIAGIVGRRIVCRLSPGDELQRGERFGMVKFGSRVELYLPRSSDIEILVRPGDKVKAGRDVVARYVEPQVLQKGEAAASRRE